MNRTEAVIKNFTGWFIIMFLAFFLASCELKGQKPEDAIINKWEEIGGTEVMEFFKDGTLTLADAEKGRNFKGTYEFVSKHEIKIELEGRKSFNLIFAKFMIINGELNFEMSDGRVYRYKKSK